MTTDETRLLKRESSKLRKALADLTDLNLRFIAALDAEMEQPATPERGSRVARLSNALEMATDRVRYFTLKVDYRTDDRRKLRIRPLEVPE